MRVAIVTDNDFDKVNGVTTTLRAVVAHAPADVEARIYTASDFSVDAPSYCAMRSWGIGIPWYSEMRMYWPRPRRLAERLREDRIDVVHLTTPGPIGLAGRLLAGRLGLPMVGSYHTRLGDYLATLSGSASLGRGFESYVRWFYGACQPLLVTTPAIGDRLGDLGYRRERLAVWSRGVDTTLFSPDQRSAALRDRWHVSDRRPAILYAGRLSREKGLDALEAIGRQLDRDRVAHRLVLVGDGPMRGELQQRCPDAVLTGTLAPADVAVAMASADVFLFPSVTDTLGNVVLEAQASGLPVVLADEQGPGENIRPGETGFIGGDDPIRMAARLRELLRDARLRDRMATAARTYAETRRWDVALSPLFRSWREAAHRRDVTVPAEDLVLQRPAARRPS